MPIFTIERLFSMVELNVCAMVFLTLEQKYSTLENGTRYICKVLENSLNYQLPQNNFVPWFNGQL
jgi:hypothetical protein